MGDENDKLLPLLKNIRSDYVSAESITEWMPNDKVKEWIEIGNLKLLTEWEITEEKE